MKFQLTQILPLADNYDQQYVSTQLVRVLPRLIGPCLGKVGKFPTMLRDDTNLEQLMDERYRTVKFQLKKTLQQKVAVGTTELSNEQLHQNITTALLFLISLLKNGKANIKKLYIKSTMGPAVRFY